MIYTISGLCGSGKTATGKELTRVLNTMAGAETYQYASGGEFFRDIAKQRGMTLEELKTVACKDPEIDDQVDQRTIKLAATFPNLVIESRIGWRFIPHSVKISLICPDDVRYQRIHKRDGCESYKAAMEKTHARDRIDRERFRTRYDIADFTDQLNYDIVINTGTIPIGKVMMTILSSAAIIKSTY